MSIDNDAECASIDRDAERFGRHFEGGWQLGLYVARSVHKQPRAGRPPKSEPVRNKVTCAQFAAKAGVSERTVQWYYDTWQLAAEEGHCTPADQLSPGDEDPLSPDTTTTEHRDMWRKFYRQTRERRAESANARTGSKRQRGRTSNSHARTDEHSDSTENEPPSAESEISRAGSTGGEKRSDPTDHPLYGLLLALNNLSDELKRGGSVASIIPAAEKTTTAQHRAALRRVIGVL